MRDAGLSVTYGVPSGMGPGEVTHLPVESGKHVGAGEPVVTVRTEVDYHTLRAEQSGTVLVLVRLGEKVGPEAPLVILQADEDAAASPDQMPAGVPAAPPCAEPDPDDIIEPEPFRHGPPPAWPMEIARPGQPHTNVGFDPPSAETAARTKRRLSRRRWGRSRGGGPDTVLRIGIAIALYLSGVLWLLPQESARLAAADDLRRWVVIGGAAILGILVWFALGRRGSAAAARSIGVIAMVWVGMAGLTAFSLLPTETTADRAAVAAAAASREPVIAALGRKPRSGGKPNAGTMMLDTRWLDIFRRAPNGNSLATQASLHQKLRSAPISRPMLPETHPQGSMNLPTNLPPKTRAEIPPKVRAAHRPSGADRTPVASVDLSVWDSTAIAPAEATVKSSPAEAGPARLQPTSRPPDG